MIAIMLNQHNYFSNYKYRTHFNGYREMQAWTNMTFTLQTYSCLSIIIIYAFAIQTRAKS